MGKNEREIIYIPEKNYVEYERFVRNSGYYSRKCSSQAVINWGESIKFPVGDIIYEYGQYLVITYNNEIIWLFHVECGSYYEFMFKSTKKDCVESMIRHNREIPGILIFEIMDL